MPTFEHWVLFAYLGVIAPFVYLKIEGVGLADYRHSSDQFHHLVKKKKKKKSKR